MSDKESSKKPLIWHTWYWVEHLESKLKNLSKSQFLALRKTKELDLLPVFLLHLFSLQRLGLQLPSLDKAYQKQVVNNSRVQTCSCSLQRTWYQQHSVLKLGISRWTLAFCKPLWGCNIRGERFNNYWLIFSNFSLPKLDCQLLQAILSPTLAAKKRKLHHIFGWYKWE